jgi:uncharacterized protein YbbC (DUF1343 family)
MAAVLGIALTGRVVLGQRSPAASTHPRNILTVATGIDVLQAEHFARLTGRRVTLLTNLAAHTRTGVTTLDAFRAADNLQLVALFAPEHGLTAMFDGHVTSGRDDRTGLPLYSLYDETQRPTPSMLAGVDVVAIDLPDVGARFYTYATTTAYVLEEAARYNVEVLVLDRPNPIDGLDVEGPILDSSMTSFTGYFPMPVRHGLTLGELARVFNAERQLGARLSIVPVEGVASRRVVRPDGVTLEQSLAEHSRPHCSNALSGHRRDRVEQCLGGAGHADAVRGRGRTMDRWSVACGRAEPASHPRGAILGDHVRARLE